ncbi:MAG TPA: PFL family protein [Coriobacteriia bacterium]|nr:PFL family protein [Coriobacteriia bacterium]
MRIAPEEIAETLQMVTQQNLDIRTVTLGLSLEHCADKDLETMAANVYDSVRAKAAKLVPICQAIGREYGIPIVNHRIAVTPMAHLASACRDADVTPLAHALDRAAREVGVDFVGGFSALVHKGTGDGDARVIDSIPRALSETERVCASVNVASTRTGINMDAVLRMAEVITETAHLTAGHDSFGCGKLVVFCNMVEDNPFMAGAVHGAGEPDAVINVGISGPGVVRAVVSALPGDADLTEVAEAIKATAFKITRAGELIAREAARRLGVEMGIVDLSLAPTPAEGDSVAAIIEAIGVERCGGPGTTTALALLNDAIKKGGAMGTSSIGGLSGAFIPVSEDAGMVRAVEDGALTLEKLEAMTSVCSVGLDMIVIPGDTSVETIAAIIADACAIGVINNKTTAARLIPAAGKTVGDTVEYGGLFGAAPVMRVSGWSAARLIRRGGRFPAPLGSLRN